MQQVQRQAEGSEKSAGILDNYSNNCRKFIQNRRRYKNFKKFFKKVLTNIWISGIVKPSKTETQKKDIKSKQRRYGPKNT